MYEKKFSRISNSSFTNEDRSENLNQVTEWFRRFLAYEQYLTKNTLRYELKQGEVYEVDFGRNVGCEINERHYAVVLHDANELTQNVLVCPLSTKVQDSSEHILVNIGRLPDVRTSYDSFAKISQIRTIDKVRIYIKPIMNDQGNDLNRQKYRPVCVLHAHQLKALIDGVIRVISTR